MVRAAITRRSHRRTLQEQGQPLAAQRVDREAGVIRGVKVLGLTSPNGTKRGRKYLPEALQKALSLYEGASVRTNHPRKAGDSRDVEEVFGWLESVRLDAAGEMYADLHVLNPHTDLAESVFAAAEKNPRLFGLSHNAQGDVDTIDGVEVVREIIEVRSVDLVADPATTKGLFEERRATVKVALKEWASGLFKLPKGGKRRLLKLIEDDMMPEAAEVDMPDAGMPPEEAPPEDHKEALRAGFEASINSIVSDCLSGGMDCKEGIKKIGEMLKTHEKLSGGNEPPPEPEAEPVEEEEEDLEEECDDEDKKMKESREFKLLKAEKRARILCEAEGITPDSALLESLSYLPDEDAMRRLIEREKRRPKVRGRTQSLEEASPGSHAGERAGDVVDGKTFAQALRRNSR